MDSKFIGHTSCPKCKSKDNLGEWDDGHKWCFGCGYYHPPRNNLMTIKQKLQKHLEDDKKYVRLPSDVTDILPKKCLDWLRNYGLTYKEIFENNYCYSQEKQLLIFPHTPFWWQGRYFGTETRYGKYYSSFGGYPYEESCVFWGFNNRNTDFCVLTEDIVSAIKVGRQYCSLPLLGSVVSPILVRKLATKFKSLILWLDKDKQKESIKQAMWINQFIPCKTLITEADPKTYENDIIKGYVDGN